MKKTAIIVIIIQFILLVICIDQWFAKSRGVECYRNQCDEYREFIERVAYYIPLIIENIEIANIDYDKNIITDYGNRLYSYKTMYIKPRISYLGLTSEKVNLDIKLYTPNGIQESWIDSIRPGIGQSTEEIRAYGSDNNGYGGTWEKGEYRIEVWFKDTCLGTHSFKVY